MESIERVEFASAFDLAKFLIALRKGRGLNQHQLAARLKKSAPYISGLETRFLQADSAERMQLSSYTSYASAVDDLAIRFVVERANQMPRLPLVLDE